MRILKEKYTPEEVEQRITEVRNAIGSLQDSLYILISALDDVGDFRRSYVQDYVEQVEDLGESFDQDFEDIIYPKQEYDDEEFEESLKESNSAGRCKKPKWWNSTFAKNVLDAYDSGNLTKGNIEAWETKYNGGIKPITALGTREIIDYYECGHDMRTNENITEDTIKTKDGKWAYAVQPHKIDMDLYDIRFIDNGAKASSKRFETYDDAVKFIKKTAKDNNWLAVHKTELKDKSNKLTNFGNKIASADINEDTIKTKDGKWVNKGDTGKTHGEFKTKKEADAQRKAMFAGGFKG